MAGVEHFAAVVIGLVFLGLMAELNVGQAVGSVAGARSGAKPGWSFVAGTFASRIPPMLLGAGAATAVANQLAGWFKLGRLTWALVGLAGLVVMLIALRMIVVRWGAAAPDVPPRSVTKALGARSAFVSAFLLNIVYIPNWVFSSAAVTAVASLRVGPVTSGALLLLYMVASAIVGVWLSTLRLLSHSRAMSTIDKVGDWTDMHAPMILLWITALIGLAMMVYGLWMAFQPPWK